MLLFNMIRLRCRLRRYSRTVGLSGPWCRRNSSGMTYCVGSVGFRKSLKSLRRCVALWVRVSSESTRETICDAYSVFASEN
jgi:hypothetical protein